MHVNWSRLGFERQPFRLTVDPDSYFPTPTHDEAIGALEAAFATRSSIVLIDGVPGVGKSLVARKWLDHLLPDVPRVLLPNTHAQRPAELLQAILFDMGQPYHGFSEQELRLAVTGRLLDAATGSYPTVLVIDEAHHMSPAVFEELRLLGNLETRRGPVLFQVLLSHSQLRTALKRPAYEHFAQRIAAHATILPLTVDESAKYIQHQLQAAGGEEPGIFDPEAITLLAESCGGIPRLLNRVALLALQMAVAAETPRVEVEAVLAAFDQLEMRPACSLEFEQAAEPVLLPHPSRDGERANLPVDTAAKISARHEVEPTRKSKDKPARKRTA
jgi:type II secretory pathway predicted ATPase ExeA